MIPLYLIVCWESWHREDDIRAIIPAYSAQEAANKDHYIPNMTQFLKWSHDKGMYEPTTDIDHLEFKPEDSNDAK